MIKKTYAKTGATCRVTFKLPDEVQAGAAGLAGEFNAWEPQDMRKLKDGGFSATLSLPAGSTYRFRNLLDNETWENNWEADGYVANAHGAEDSLVIV